MFLYLYYLTIHNTNYTVDQNIIWAPKIAKYLFGSPFNDNFTNIVIVILDLLLFFSRISYCSWNFAIAKVVALYLFASEIFNLIVLHYIKQKKYVFLWMVPQINYISQHSSQCLFILTTNLISRGPLERGTLAQRGRERLVIGSTHYKIKLEYRYSGGLEDGRGERHNISLTVGEFS